MLRATEQEAPAVEVFAATIRESDEWVRAVLRERQVTEQEQPTEYRRNQRCWACDERRSGRPDPDHRDGRTICRQCEALPL